MERYQRLQKLFDWPTIVGALIGAGIVMFLVYPPAPGWGSNEKWGDIATWFSGIASFGAVCVALWIATAQQRIIERNDHASRERRSLMLAIGAMTQLPWVLNCLKRARWVHANFDGLMADGTSALLHVKNGLQIETAAAFPAMPVFEKATPAIATAYADLVAMVYQYNGQIGIAMDVPFDHWSLEQWRDHLDYSDSWDSIQQKLITLAGLLANFDQRLNGIDFTERYFTLSEPTDAAKVS